MKAAAIRAALESAAVFDERHRADFEKVATGANAQSPHIEYDKPPWISPVAAGLFLFSAIART